MTRLAVLGILLIVFLASIDAFPKNRLDVRGKFIRKKMCLITYIEKSGIKVLQSAVTPFS